MEKLKTFDVDLKRLFFEVLKRLWLILLVGIVCGSGVFLYAKFFITPQYKATATIYIQNYTGENDEKIYSSDLSASQNLVTTYQGLLTSDNVLNRVKEKLGENYNVDAIRASFTAEAVEDTPILKISINNNDPEEAAKIVNEIAKVAPDAIMDLVEGSSVKVVDLATRARRNSISLLQEAHPYRLRYRRGTHSCNNRFARSLQFLYRGRG